jgi:hypothetical protein
LSSHLYADETQVYGSCRPASIAEFGLAAAIFDLQLSVARDNVAVVSIELVDPENRGLAVGILFLSCVEAEMISGILVYLIFSNFRPP